MAVETAAFQPVSGDTAIEYSARQIRNLIIGGMVSREGVRDKDGGHLRVTQRGAGANMTVDIAIGKAFVFGDDASDQGVYSINSNTVINIAIPAPSSSAARTHRVILQVRDRAERGSWPSNTYDSIIVVQADTAAGAALPNSAIMLATVTTPAQATSVTNAMITDQRGRGSIGTPLIVANLLETGFNAVYGGRDTTRPLRAIKDADGRVQLRGWCRRTGGTNTTVAEQQFWNFGGAADFGNAPAIIPPEFRPLGIVDTAMMTSEGIMHVAIQPDGRIQQRYRSPQTLYSGAGGSWFDFTLVNYLGSSFS